MLLSRGLQSCLATMAGHFDYPLYGPSVNIVKKCGAVLSEVLQHKFGCVAIIEGVDFQRDLRAQQKRPTIVPQQRFATWLRSGVKVSVWKADLTSFQADAVVNAANVSLKHYGGLAQALSETGGPLIQRESNDYIGQNGILNTGDAIVLDAGLLPYKKIIHAVGPELSFQTSPDISLAEQLLKRTIRSILDRVQEYRLKTVAIPAISSGLFHFPLPLCATTIVSTVKNYYESLSQTHLPEEILLVNNDEPSVWEMERACKQILTSQLPYTYSQAAVGKTSRPPLKMGNVLLILKKGKIEDQWTDVIVNTTGTDRNLHLGKVSMALLEKAGDRLQKAVYDAHLQGKIIITNGYSLHCKEVYHTFCTDVSEKHLHKNLFQSVLECLKMAAAQKHKSIAFPAIGTGFKFQKEEAAQIMSNAVAHFAQNCQTPMEVHFIITDNDTFKAFEKQMVTLQQKASHSSFTQGLEPPDESRERKPATPQITLTGYSDETIKEAERWISGLLNSSGTITIRNNFILHFGQREFLELSGLNKNVSIEETFRKGHAEMNLMGTPEDTVLAGLHVEAMLCNIQKEFIKEEASSLGLMSTKNVSFRRKRVDHSSPVFSDRYCEFKKEGLWLVKMETVENPSLETVFKLKKKQLNDCTSKHMLQRIPAQFCDVVSHIGFHVEYAPPADPAYGEGIYFAGTVAAAMKVWEKQNEEYLYFVEAEVLTGNSAPGKPGLILPPSRGSDPFKMYDSVHGGVNVSVIFSGYQAMPKCIFTCKMQ
ncbi:protein mono-ADP-ribosyltransferase PARP9 isoform X2 [Echeneis naucrates]|uniref:protein mono-ADP-ribosyltransferase PARP9 isoform X2 n=1 Tax=Echeneis naucrates TaxID=173247 RepID=UPI001114503E|nr:protein mono-ADP-ribosyltransferase PARP9-like isoform X2 [Echeneis naucrates]